MTANPPIRRLPHLTLATRVTVLRILGVPFFLLLMVYYNLSLPTGNPVDAFRIGALALFAGIALTDALDGYLARSRGEITPLGRMLDPLADKLLLLSAVAALTRPSLAAFRTQLPIWFSLTVISRDVFLLLGYLVVHHHSGSFEVRPRLAGKIATFLQMATVVWLLASVVKPHLSFFWLAAAAAAFTGFSGLQYLFDGLRRLELHHLASEPGSGGPRAA
jgi:CDP-diacylglycerol--glycerol-3-phosphate 3-phosphatidyltransferase